MRPRVCGANGNGLATREKPRNTVGTARVRAVPHQAVKVEDQIGSQDAALHQRDRAAIGLVGTRPACPITWHVISQHTTHNTDAVSSGRAASGKRSRAAAAASSQGQEAVGQDAAIEEGVEFNLDTAAGRPLRPPLSGRRSSRPAAAQAAADPEMRRGLAIRYTTLSVNFCAYGTVSRNDGRCSMRSLNAARSGNMVRQGISWKRTDK